MKVKVKTNFLGQPELEIDMPTLRKVLLNLSKRDKVLVINLENEEVRSDFKVYLNGVDYESLPHGINTEIKDGDKVEVTLVILAGG
jgi:molybdopterin converting factor small subunit